MSRIAWLSWNAESFARARAEAKPILLAIAPNWCVHSREMDLTTYRDGDICDLVNSRFVPIRVDADRRPDVSERYGLGGWPTTAFLTSDGRIIGGGTNVAASRLAEALRQVSDAVAAGRHLGARLGRSAARDETGDERSLEQLVTQVVESFDSTHGGFGESPKFPHAAPVRLALALYRESGSQEYYDMAVRSLDAMAWGPLYDDRHGGFFSYSQDADWTRPHQAKLLDVNASLVTLYLDALETLQLARYGERAEDVVRYIQTWLADPVDGGWAASQCADEDGTTAASIGPLGDAPPAIDRTLYSDANGAMVSAALQAGQVLGDPALSEFAIKSLEHVLLLGYRPGAGVAHCTEDGALQVRGLLEDQIAMAVANLDAFEATGNVVYEMMAEELALYATRTMWDNAAGGFCDRATDPRRDIGLLREPVKPFTVNCTAALMLGRLARTSKSGDFAEFAARTLRAMSRRASAEGPRAAEYVLAARAAGPVIDSFI